MTDDRWQMTNQMVADSVKDGVDDPMRLPGDDLSFVIWDFVIPVGHCPIWVL
jgi:hypothetical protein